MICTAVNGHNITSKARPPNSRHKNQSPKGAYMILEHHRTKYINLEKIKN